MSDRTPTHSALLELREERQGMQEGYGFLDEKRLVLAGEILAQLGAYEQARARFDDFYRQAVAALRAAIARHGLEGLEVYPPLATPDALLEVESRRVLGVSLGTARLDPGEVREPPAIHPSPEGNRCRTLFEQVIREGAALAARSGNLRRLWEEYRRTARRARALEDVLLPEIEEDLRLIEAGLEELDREEAVRVRHFRNDG